MSHKSTFGERLAFERKRLGLNQSEFAKICGVRSASQFLYEKNSRSPNTDYLFQAVGAGVRLGYLFQTGEGDEALPMLTLEQMVASYIDIDSQCRTADGKLLDLEYRVRAFKERITGEKSAFFHETKKNVS